MHKINEFEQRQLLDEALADNIANILVNAVKLKGRASIAVSGGSTPKGFFILILMTVIPN